MKQITTVEEFIEECNRKKYGLFEFKTSKNDSLTINMHLFLRHMKAVNDHICGSITFYNDDGTELLLNGVMEVNQKSCRRGVKGVTFVIKCVEPEDYGTEKYKVYEVVAQKIL